MTKVDSREEILEACRKEIALNGVRGLRVQHVAKRAGTSLGLVYYHFTDRAGLLTATIDAVNREVSKRWPKIELSRDPEEVVIEMLVAEFGDDEITRSDSVVWNEIRAIAIFEEELQAPLTETTEQWQEIVSKLLTKIGVKEEDLEPAARLLTTLVEGVSSRWLTNQVTTEEAQDLMRKGATGIINSFKTKTD